MVVNTFEPWICQTTNMLGHQFCQTIDFSAVYTVSQDVEALDGSGSKKRQTRGQVPAN